MTSPRLRIARQNLYQLTELYTDISESQLQILGDYERENFEPAKFQREVFEEVSGHAIQQSGMVQGFRTQHPQGLASNRSFMRFRPTVNGEQAVRGGMLQQRVARE